VHVPGYLVTGDAVSALSASPPWEVELCEAFITSYGTGMMAVIGVVVVQVVVVLVVVVLVVVVGPVMPSTPSDQFDGPAEFTARTLMVYSSAVFPPKHSSP
jgi:hypothetical protein